MNTRKRLLATLLTLVMIVSMLSVSVLAEGDGTTAPDTTTEYAGGNGQKQEPKAAIEPEITKAGTTIPVYFDVSEGGEKGPSWSDSAVLYRSNGCRIASPPSSYTVKAMPGYKFAYTSVNFWGTHDMIYPDESQYYPKEGYWSDSIDSIKITFVFEEAPKHKVTFQYNTTNAYPSDEQFIVDPEAEVSETAIYTLPAEHTTSDTTYGSRNGKWTFTWTAKDANGTNILISESNGAKTFKMPKTDVTVTGSWKFTPNTHKVIFELNGGHFDDPSTPLEATVTDNNDLEHPGYPEKDDYFFAGWFTDSACTNEYSFSNNPVKGGMTLHAGWIRARLMTFDMNGGTLGGVVSLSKSFAEGDSVELPGIDTMEEWIRKGSVTAPADSEYIGAEITDKTGSKTYSPGEKYTVIDSEATIKVLWKSTIIPTSTISFDLNGGTLDGKTGIVTIQAEEGSTITLPAPTKEGYTFDYWEGSRYKAGDRYTVNGDHRLTAQWKKNANTNADPTSNKTAATSPNTGDENNLLLWFVMICAALFVMFQITTHRE